MPSKQTKPKATEEQLAHRRKKSVQTTLRIPLRLEEKLFPSWGSMGKCPDDLARGIWKAFPDAAKPFISIPALPKTLNSMKIGRRKHKLHPDVEVFRDMMRRAMLIARTDFHWRPVLSGRHILLVVLESQKWVTAKGMVAVRDADNRLKVVLDALHLAVGSGEADDSNAWSVHVFKLQSWEERTTVGAIPLPASIPWVMTNGEISRIGQEALFPADRPRPPSEG